MKTLEKIEKEIIDSILGHVNKRYEKYPGEYTWGSGWLSSIVNESIEGYDITSDIFCVFKDLAHYALINSPKNENTGSTNVKFGNVNSLIEEVSMRLSDKIWERCHDELVKVYGPPFEEISTTGGN